MDNGFLSNCPTCCGQLVKILIIFEQMGYLGQIFAYLFISLLSSNWYAKQRRGFAEHHFGQDMYFSENAYIKLLDSMVYFFVKFCILIHFNIIETQVCKTAISPLSRIFYLARPSHRIHTCVSIKLKCIRTRFRTEPISERLLQQQQNNENMPS